MPSLFRFLMWIGIIAAIGYGAMFALVTLVEPERRQMSVRVPAGRLDPQPIRTQPAAQPPAAADTAGTGSAADR